MTIKITDIQFNYNQRRVLKGCSLIIERGNIYGLLGANGAGKTTLMKIIKGLLKPQNGDVEIDGRNTLAMTIEEISQKIATVSQDTNQVFPFSVLDMVTMGRNPHIKLFGKPIKEDYIKAEESLALVGGLYLKERIFNELSGGERQLVMIARALAQQTPYILFDEPTAHLDFTNQHVILKVIRDVVKKNNLGVLICMHDPNLVYQYCSHSVMIHEGQVLSKGLTKEVFNEGNLSYLYGTSTKISRIDNGLIYVSAK
ncbi:ABC transporter ATP-binding protein [Alkalicella caledoniensis]|uniref:ABC transporter ATP-binding protein n=1 Tax=Alkalicella caledoniensis TaxID=2731377 RepID=A0A7G9WB27_ALKCA|nr:ABC transporter ATP-binding protein [Alkalicella caledoniensis]QNO15889.1 ABC transporter ATP-binding protein [Alkalicella caledoniensis]